MKPETGILDLMLFANSNPDKPCFLILDEMNLSHVERYFADFLSAMESGEEIFLHSFSDSEQPNVANPVPSSIKIPANLFIIGTVNVDETTYMFSPKVLDRANTIEFRISNSDMDAFLNAAEGLNPGHLDGSGSDMAGSFLEIAAERAPAGAGEYTAVLNTFFTELQKVGAEFGYRSAGEMLRFIYMLERVHAGYTSDQKVDLAILQKVLPKLHGSRRKLCPVLVSLTKMCLNPDSPAQNQNIEQTILLNAEFVINEGVRYPNTLEKLIRMYRSAVDLGFTSFAEA